VMFADINPQLALPILLTGVTIVPFPVHRPVDHLGSTADLMYFERNLLAEPQESLMEAIARDATANGIELFDEAINFVAQIIQINPGLEIRQIECLGRHQATKSG